MRSNFTKQNSRTIFVFTLILCLASCGKLTKEEAQKQIIENEHWKTLPYNTAAIGKFQQEYYVRSQSLSGWTACAVTNKGNYNWYQQMLEKMQQEGLITLNNKNYDRGSCRYIYTVVEFTPKGLPLFISESTDKIAAGYFSWTEERMVNVKLCEETFVAIGEIQKNKNGSVTVNYTTQYNTLTPFGKILIDAQDPQLKYLVKNRGLIGRMNYYTAQFKKENDKWVIEGISKHAPKSNSPQTKSNSSTTPNTASERSQVTMAENSSMIGTYTGTIGTKPFKLEIEKVTGNDVEGYNVTGKNKRSIKGTVTGKSSKETGMGGYYTEFTLVLAEPGDDKWDGEFNIKLTVSDQGRRGEGNWKSFNGQLQRKVEIKSI